MYHVVELDLTSLDLHQLKGYELLTSPEYRICLSGKDPYGITDSNIIVLGLKTNDTPVGIIIANRIAVLRLAQIYFLNLAVSHITAENVAALLSAMEANVKAQGVINLTIKYPDNIAAAVITEALKTLHWQKPIFFLLTCLFKSKDFNPTWLQKPYSYPPGFVEFPWLELTSQERDQIMHEQEQGLFLPSVSPFGDENIQEPLNSLGLRYNDRVIGWMITHRIDTQTIRYSALFIHPEWQQSHLWIKLLSDAIRLQKSSSVPFALLEIKLSGVDHSWLNFIKRRLIPHTCQVIKTYQSSKRL